ncbi:unnamed protein product [Withania somnifera]
MGIFSHTPNKGKCDLSNPFLEGQRRLRRQRGITYNVVNGRYTKGKKCKNRLMKKRRVRMEGYRRTENEIGRKVRVLKKLIPNCKDLGMEGIFRETADYILALEMRVKVMQVMINVLSPSNSD